jgi:hypothetical protein
LVRSPDQGDPVTRVEEYGRQASPAPCTDRKTESGWSSRAATLARLVRLSTRSVLQAAGRPLALAGAVLALVASACDQGPSFDAPSPSATRTATTTAPTASSSARERFLAPDGSDKASGGRDDPWRTLKHSLGQLRPGDVLLVRGGDYVERIEGFPLAKGTPDRRIRVAAQPGERPVLRGMLELKELEFWTFDGINVTWDGGSSEDHMVKLVGGRGWIWENAEVWGARSFANILVANAPSDWVIRGSCIHDAQAKNPNDAFRYHNIYANTELAAGPGLIEGNLLFNASTGSNLKLGGPGDSAEEGAANVTVRYNTLYRAMQPVLLSGGSRDNVMERNIVGLGLRDSPNYLVRSYRLVGEGNLFRDNIGFGAAALYYSAFPEGFGGVADGGGNRFPFDPEFDAVDTCDGFRTGAGDAALYGRYAGPP